ncbi:hypothetical protein [Salinimicrobium flavum]|uniref:SPOR domain-containing protein n=1 Tax=Salinimicrobium flavum TaxID=1737065 RepID=A0ABW5IZ13_9FLAO
MFYAKAELAQSFGGKPKNATPTGGADFVFSGGDFLRNSGANPEKNSKLQAPNSKAGIKYSIGIYHPQKLSLLKALEENQKTQRRQAGRTLYFQVGTFSGTAELIRKKIPNYKHQIPKLESNTP